MDPEALASIGIEVHLIKGYGDTAVAECAIGLLFALVIDTVAHVSAWSVFATHQGGWWAGALAGLLFSGGMLIASTADSQLVSRVLRSAGSEAAASRLRRGIGWFVVILSFGVVAHAVWGKLAE